MENEKHEDGSGEFRPISAAEAEIPLPLVLTVQEAADALRIGRNQAYELVRRGDLQAVRCGRTWRVPRESLFAFLSAGG